MNKISIKKKTENFIVLDKTALNDSRLSWKAKGIHSYLMSLPDDWDLFISDLENRSKDGRDSTRAAINELIEHGYIFRKTKKEKGKFMGYDYSVYENPIKNESFTDKPKTEKPQRINRNDKTENGLSENGKANTNEYTYKEILNKENIDNNEYLEEKNHTPQNENVYFNDDVPFGNNGLEDFEKFRNEKKPILKDSELSKEELDEKYHRNPLKKYDDVFPWKELPIEETENISQVAGGGGKKKLPKKEKEVKVDNKKDLLECYPDEESFVNAWELRFAEKYPKVDASKGYNRLLNYSLNKGVKYVDWVLTLNVWYNGEKNKAHKEAYHYDEKEKITGKNYITDLMERAAKAKFDQ